MTWEIVSRLLVSCGLGAIVGFEREVHDQPAGLRTHLSVALGACLFGIISTLGFAEFEQRRELTNVQIDVTRVASNVVVGIGFLGAGVIFRQGTRVHNLTTAASLWVTAAIGLAAGVGDPGGALVATLALVAGLVLLRPVRTLVATHLVRQHRIVRIELVSGAPADPLLAALHTSVPHITVTSLSLDRIDGRIAVRAEIEAAPHHSCSELTDQLARRSDVWRLESASVE